MPRRRLISDEIIANRGFNELSIEAQAVWSRMLAKSDDFGVLPADEYELSVLINLPVSLKGKLNAILKEYVSAGMAKIVPYLGKQFFVFKPDTFNRNQSFINGRRTKSECMRLKRAEFEEIVHPLFCIEITQSSMQVEPSAPRTVESNKQQVTSSKQKEERPREEKKTADAFFEHLPANLDSPEFRETWQDWCECRKFDVKEPITERGAKTQFKMLLRIRDPADRIRCLENSIAGKWQGIFPDKFETFETIRKHEQQRNQRPPSEQVKRAQHTVSQSRLEAIAAHHSERELRRTGNIPVGADGFDDSTDAKPG
jgi:hypothetical protein